MYSLLYLSWYITFELFADALNESSVPQRYCSLDEKGSSFVPAGSRDDVENVVEGQYFYERRWPNSTRGTLALNFAVSVCFFRSPEPTV